MSAFDIKLLRDLWRMRGQALAIALVLAAATATFVLSTGVHRSLSDTRDAYYGRNRFADVFADLTRAPRSILARVAAIPGVRQSDGTIRQYATLDFADRPAPVRVLINSVDEYGHDRLNRLTLKDGRLPAPGNPGEVVVDEAFAEANSLGIGDSVQAVIYGSSQRLKVVGIGLAPNFIYSIAPGDLVPDNRRFGIFWMGRKALEGATDRTEAINSLAVTLERDASEGDVIRALDSLLAPYGGTGAYGRKDHLSHAFLDNELMQLDAMTRVIPPIFLGVSTFLVYIVLGRMIRTERTQIGLLKAFGYSDWAIGWHYLKFALAIAVLATAIGWLAGIWMGSAMTRLYAQYYRFPFLYYHIAPGVLFGAGALALAASALGALGGTAAAIRLNPAVAMSPPPPPVYRAGMVERIGRRLGFTTIGHMIVRHVARWPGRSAVTVFGLALSMALLFSTLQFLDSSRAMLDEFFLRGQRQDLTVTFTEPRNERAIFALAQLPGVQRVEAVRAAAVRLRHGSVTKRAAIESAAANSALSLRIDRDGNVVTIPPAGLMLSRQLADELRVRAGETIEVELLGGRSTRAEMPVTRIVDELVGARAYAGNDTLERLARDASPAGAALVKIDPAARAEVLAALKSMPVVLGVSERDAALETFEEMIDSNLNTMLFFYISFAAAIAVGVVYNSARILFSERAHELATLRVLGYHRNEVGLLLVGELALLVAVSLPLGCVLGYWMAQLMTAMFSSDLFRLPFAPSRSSYGFAALVVSAAAMGTALVVARRVRQLDMVRVLKAHD